MSSGAGLLIGCAQNSDVSRLETSLDALRAREAERERQLRTALAAAQSERRALSVERNELLARLQVLEGRLQPLETRIDPLERTVQGLSGRASTLRSRTENVREEQLQVTDQLDRLGARLRELEQRQQRLAVSLQARDLESERLLDGIRSQLRAVEALLQTRLARLPRETQADRAWRSAFAALIDGRMDEAALDFAQFAEQYTDDPRLPEARYRQAQAYALVSRYNEALPPLLDVIEQYPDHPLYADARWMLARALEETGDLRLARSFYSQLVLENTPYKIDAQRRIQYIQRLLGR